ncbi:carotenoid oxygenase, partial [Fennellomyces sp. T-0311]
MGFLDLFTANSKLRALQSENKFENTPEVPEPVWNSIEGTIPPWVSGILFRTGPAKYNLGKDEKQYMIRHAFDGLPFVHRFEVSADKQAVRYNSRLVAEGVERKLINHPSKGNVFFGHIPDVSVGRSFLQLLDRIGGILFPVDKSQLGPSDEVTGVTVTPNYPTPSNFAPAANDDHVLVAKTDANILQQVHSDTLEPTRLFDYGHYDKRLAGALSAAHHQWDPETNEIFNFSIKFGRKTTLTVFTLDSKGKVTVNAVITERLLPNGERSTYLPGYVHAFWLTKNYIIIPESPLHYPNKGIDVILRGTVSGAMAWREDGPAYLHIISRDPNVGHVVSLPVHPFFTFHTANAWDSVDSDGNPVIEMDCSAYNNGNIVYQVHRFNDMDRFSGESKASRKSIKMRGIEGTKDRVMFGELRRYRATWNLEAKTGDVTFTTIAPNVEFPRFAQDLTTKPNRYIWGCQHEDATANDGDRFSLVKIDTETGSILKFERPAHVFSEPVLVPNPDSKEEDDGALMSFANITDSRGPEHNRCILSIVNSKTMEEMGRCDIGPFHATTFHGSFVDVDFVSVNVN